MRRSALTWAAIFAAVPLGIALVAAGPEPGRGGRQQPAGAVFTAQQATAGSSVYAASCASCHMRTSPDETRRRSWPATIS